MKITFYEDKHKNDLISLLSEQSVKKVLCASGQPKLPKIGFYNIVLVATDGDEFIGFVSIEYAGRASALFINSIALKKKHIGKGYGTKLLKEAIKVGKNNWLCTHAKSFTVENPDGEMLLAGCGFKEGGVYKNHTFSGGKLRSQTLWQKKI